MAHTRVLVIEENGRQAVAVAKMIDRLDEVSGVVVRSFSAGINAIKKQNHFHIVVLGVNGKASDESTRERFIQIKREMKAPAKFVLFVTRQPHNQTLLSANCLVDKPDYASLMLSIWELKMQEVAGVGDAVREVMDDWKS